MEEYVRDSKRMEGRVKVLSCGLAETMKLSNKTTVVQFIYQSVQDFCLDRGLSVLHDSLEGADINLSEPGFAGSLHCLLSKSWIRIVQLVRDFFRDKNSLIVGCAHYKLSRTCIQYLAMEELAQIPGELAKTRHHSPVRVASRFPLLEYAINEWLAHVVQSDAKNISQGNLLSYFAWPSETLLQRYTSIKNKLWPYSGVDILNGTRLVHIVSAHHLKEPLRMILQRADQGNTDINAKDDKHRTPLSYTAFLRYEAIVKLLVERSDVIADSKDKDGQIPLSHAVFSGEEVVVKLLVERSDVIADLKDKDDRTPLSYAKLEMHKAVRISGTEG